MIDKPILVENEPEWLRLAPVLKKLGYRWPNNNKLASEWNPYVAAPWDFNKSITVYLKGKSLSWSPTYPINEQDTQTVDEYLQANSLTTNKLPKVSDIDVVDLNYKALYEAQTKAIKEAVLGISRKRLFSAYDNEIQAYKYAIKIIKEKLGQ